MSTGTASTPRSDARSIESAYARRTGSLVIAEGIESEAILAFVRHAHELDAVRDLSIEGGQGYLLGRPALAPEPVPLLA